MSQFKKATIADRGKWAEKEVEKVLTAMSNNHLGFAYERLADARAAGGRLKAQLCDFLCWWAKANVEAVSIMLEVKEIQHDYRLPKDKLKQLARMRKVSYAGAEGVVLVYHSTIDKWRCMSLSFFHGDITPSWDLSSEPVYDNPAAALRRTGLFPAL